MLTAGSFSRRMPITGGMTYEQMLTACDACTAHIVEDRLDGDIAGLYDEALQTIIIDSRMTDVQKRCTLAHELFHWLHADDACSRYGRNHEERRVKRETAMLLIPPAAYVRAERAYDGEIFLMACELEVTVFMVECYRSILEGRLVGHAPERSDAIV